MRKVSLGIIPDFAYSGRGCRISGLVPSTPAESSGLRQGDVIVTMDSREVHNLRDLANILTSLNPGDRIPITFWRGEEKLTVEVEVAERCTVRLSHTPASEMFRFVHQLPRRTIWSSPLMN